MDVSIIITTYNYARYVERAIRSCLNQSLMKSKYEVIVVNDASTDYTEEILENYHDVVRVYNLENNVGLAGARNFGIKKARGMFVVFLDADDYIHNDLVLMSKTFLVEDNKLDAVAVDYQLVDERGTHLKKASAEEKPIACGIMFRKDLLYEIGLYDESFRAREEQDLRIRFLKKYQIFNIPLALYRYRMHGKNLTSNLTEMGVYAEKLKDKHSD
jgi:glycosyltransferase involved in cell wall biosynthesis